MIKVKVISPFVDRETKVLNKLDAIIEVNKERLIELKDFVEIIKDTTKKESNEG